MKVPEELCVPSFPTKLNVLPPLGPRNSPEKKPKTRAGAAVTLATEALRVSKMVAISANVVTGLRFIGLVTASNSIFNRIDFNG